MARRFLASLFFVSLAALAQTGDDLQAHLGGDGGDGYLRALSPRAFHFPGDHAAHTGFRTEWWYVTGNLDAAGGRRFGFQWTLFRVALRPDEPSSGASAWRARHLWMGHFAITDVAGGRHRSYERFSREALGLAGVEGNPPRLWLEDWSLDFAGDQWLLAAETGEVGLNLALRPLGPAVLQGDGGLSQKSSQPGNASYYYSFPRLRADGRLRLDGADYAVSGLAWLDREWSTSALGPEQQGWDWFSLQLDDGSDLMYYRLRRGDGASDRHSAGTLRSADGVVHRLGAQDVELEPLSTWTSPQGRRYPIGWRLRVPAQALDLRVEALLEDQEMRHRVSYWEGAVQVSGQRAGQSIQGRGYLELAGYAKAN